LKKNQKLKKEFPKPFVERMTAILADETDQLLSSLSSSAVISVRLNSAKKPTLSFEDIENIPWSKTGFYLPERPYFTHDPLLHAGAYYVQEASSMFLEQYLSTFLSSIENPIVLDLCAAPGGKSTHILNLMNGKGLLVANEIVPNRNAILRENLIKWGYPNFIVTQSEAKDFAKEEELFDVIVVDAPCSGEGMFRKDERAISEWSEKNIETCVIRQSEIISHIAKALKPGGILVYSTCTFEPEENIYQLQKLFETGCYDVFLPEVLYADFGMTKITYKQSVGFSFYPHKIKGEGFFIGALQKKKEGKVQMIKAITEYNDKLYQEYIQWVKPDANFTLSIQNGRVSLKSKLLKYLGNSFKHNIHVKLDSIAIGEWKGKDFIASPELAFSILKSDFITKIELDLPTAIKYLKSESITIADAEKGWYLVTFQGLGLGWVKVLEGRINNYYPSNWRILK
jgi:16S rRNA C967 or C1407 C5-methylase (RsmB/RsmF family)/NOL1/NOP2/fmu family ribosome biogenesis protein